MDNERKLEAGLILLLLIFGSATAIGSVPRPDGAYFLDETVEETLEVEVENVTLDNYYPDGDQERVYGKWAILGNQSGNVTELQGSDWTRLYPDQEGDVNFQKQFEFQPDQTGNYTLSVTVAKANGFYNQTSDEWNWENINELGSNTKNIQVYERSGMAMLGEGFAMTMMK